MGWAWVVRLEVGLVVSATCESLHFAMVFVFLSLCYLNSETD